MDESAAVRLTKVIQMGLGPIGQRVVKDLAQRSDFELVGVIDIDPKKVGQDAGLLSGTRSLGVEVQEEAQEVLSGDADLVFLTTGSSLASIESQLTCCIQADKSVISTCEELAYAFDAQPSIASKIDRMAIEHQVVVLGTGVNPGFLMDALPIFLSSVCRRVNSVRIERYQDASIRRLPFQQKIGAALTPDEFEVKRVAGQIRHVGFTESIQLIGAALGWVLDRVEDRVEPVIARKNVVSQYLSVDEGLCAGLRQVGYGYRNKDLVVSLELQAYLGHPDPRDRVVIDGDPPIDSTIAGGVDGDVATSSMVLNTVSAISSASPGLRTMVDIPLSHWRTSALGI